MSLALMNLGDSDINIGGSFGGNAVMITGPIIEGDPCEVWVADGQTYYQANDSQFCKD